MHTFSSSDSVPATGGTFSGAVTLPSPVINTGVSGSAVLDSDTMSGASATKISSSESIKAYVDVAINKNWDSTNSSILGGKSLVLSSSQIQLSGSATVSLGSTTYTNLVAGSTIVATIEFAIDNSVTTPKDVNGDVQITDGTSTVVAAKTYEDDNSYRRMETIVGSAIFTSADPVAVKTFTAKYLNHQTADIHTQSGKHIVLHIREYI